MMKKKVAVIGTGPAGMSAAYVLAKGGFDVTVFEKSSTIGGKVTSYDKDNKSFEHGIHGWWHNYLNWLNIIKDIGIKEEDIFKDVRGSTMVTKNGVKHPLKVVSFPLPSPLFMIWQMLTAPYLKLKDGISAIRIGIVLFGFNQKEDYEKYDQLSFQELLNECGVSETLQSLLFTPFILSFDFTVPDRVSAACGLSGMNFYVLRDQLSVCTRWLKGTPNDLVFDPMRELMQSKFGVNFVTSAKVNSINFTSKYERVVGCKVVSDSFKSSSTELITTVSKSFFPATGYAKVAGYNILVGTLSGALVAFDSTCSHNGCSVNWISTDNLFECPCHGGKYKPDGTVFSGPPPAPLQQYTLEPDGDNILIKSNLIEKDFVFDEIIVAGDVVNSKNIMINSLPAPHVINQNLSKLDTTPVIVVRCWFKGQNYLPEIDSAITPEFQFIDNFFNLNSFSNDYDAQGHVVEVQSYRVFAIIDTATDDQIIKLALTDLQIIDKRYNQENLLDHNINRHVQLFTRYAPRLNSYRPNEYSGIPGMYFAGDWTAFEYPVWMMERAVSSGIRAANAICEKHDATKFDLLLLNKGGFLFRLTQFTCRILLKLGEFKFRRFFDRLYDSNSYKEIHIIPRTRDKSGLYFQKPEDYSWWDWAIFLLHTAAEIEHSLMVQYLFTAYSINPVFGSAEFDMVNRWKNTILGIAVEEMGHLLTVQSVLKVLRAPTNFNREAYPFRSEFYPFPFQLQKFDLSVLCKYIIAEMPNSPPNDELKKVIGTAKVPIQSEHLNNTGILYEDIISILKDNQKVPDALFDNNPTSSTLYQYWSFSKGIISENVTDRKSILEVLNQIAEQGEGINDQDNSHFERFLSIYREFDTLDTGRIPYVSVEVDPNPTLIPNSKNLISEGRALLWAEVFNIKYRITLNMLNHMLNTGANEDKDYLTAIIKDMLGFIHAEMSGTNGHAGMKQIADRLFALPLSSTDKFGLRAGPTFGLPFTLELPDTEMARWQLYSELCTKECELLTELLKYDSEKSEANYCLALSGTLLKKAQDYQKGLL